VRKATAGTPASRRHNAHRDEEEDERRGLRDWLSVIAKHGCHKRLNVLDVDPFVVAVVGGGVAAVPEPSTLLLCLIALGLVTGWRKWKHAA
jgi:hypothetical protein